MNKTPPLSKCYFLPYNIMGQSFRTLSMQYGDECRTLHRSSDPGNLTVPPCRVFPYDTGNIRDWYDVETFSVLGAGSSSTTFKCFERGATSKRPCACKAIPKADPFNTFPKIRQEAKILFVLLHQPNIITLHDVFEDDDYVYLVMEFGNGGELFNDFNRRTQIAERTRRPSSLPLYSEAEVASIMLQIMSAMRACHSVGITHRDLKPENVLIVDKDENGFPKIKIIDFGLSTFTQPGEVLHELVGTLMYIAPEVAQQAYNHKADVWGAGCIMFTLLCGYHPFQHVVYNSLRELVTAQTNHEGFLLQFASDIKGFKSISSAGQDILRKMLMVNPSSRLTVDEFFKHPWITCHMGKCHNLQTRTSS